MQPINIINGSWKQGVEPKVVNLTGTAFMEEAGAHVFHISAEDASGAAIAFTGTVSALFLRADNTTVAIDGKISDGAAEVTLVSDCYHVPGRFSIAIYVSDGTDSACVYAAVGNVYRTSSDVVIDSGATIPTLAQLQAAYQACIEATEQATNAVSYETQTGKTDAQKATARENIGAASDGDVSSLKNHVTEADGDITSKMTYVRGDNLCRGDSTVTSGYMAANGTVYTSYSYVYTDKIPVDVGDVIRAYNTQSGTFAQRLMRYVTALDSSGDVVSASGVGGDGAWSYTVPSGIAYVIISIAVGSNYMVSYGAVKTSYSAFSGHYVATSAFLANTVDGKVDKNGSKQVTSDNITDLVKTDKYTQSVNIFSDAELLGSGEYVDIGSQSGKLILRDNSDYDSYILPVDGSVYKFTNCRFALLLESDQETPVGTVLSNVTSIDTEGASYIAFSFAPATYPAATYVLTKTLSIYEVVNWAIKTGGVKEAKASNSGAIASGGSLIVSGRSSIKDGELIVFKGDLTSIGDGFKLNFYGSSVTNYIEVTASKIAVKYNSSAAVDVDHELDFSTAHTVTLTVQFAGENANIKLYADGSVYSVTYAWYQTGGTVTEPRIVSTGAVFSAATLTVTYAAAKRGIWYFGDSYISMSDERWPYYLNADGYAGNVLLNGSPGSTSGGAMIAMNALINVGTPKIAVFATGMNDGSDSGETPVSAWSTKRDEFIAICEENGITPIFCTVPSVQSVNNEAKNAWVRASGYRYIDFAKAVGATVSGGTTTWYSGLLSSDNVHPTAAGAKALYTQVLIDLPEITI